ncbi:transposable element Tcb2 transposase [Trichonephila clavipes]|nr:transposable element Tcb2 transposase [Trichonephila clavipes]
MQHDCALRIASRGRLTSFSVEYKTGNQGLFECAESFTKEKLMYTCHYAIFEDNMSSCHSLRGEESTASGSPSSAAIQAQVAHSLGAPVSSRTIRRRLAEGHMGSRHPLRVLPLTPTYRRLRLKWSRVRRNWTAADWNQVVISDESRFNLSNDGNRDRVLRPRGERLNPAFALQRHTTTTAGVMAWGAITYNTRSALVLNCGTMTSQQYVHNILQPHALSLMQRLQGAIFHQDNTRPHTVRVSQDYLCTVTTLP